MSDAVQALIKIAATAPQSAAVQLSIIPTPQRLAVRADPDTVAAMNEVLGFELPTAHCRGSRSNDRTALWLGPDEWLVLGDRDGAVPATPFGASIVDVSHGFVAILVSGERAAITINAGCALDLHIAAFPSGMCTRTLFGKAQIVLWRLDTEMFRMEVARSFAPYVWDLLEEARREFLG